MTADDPHLFGINLSAVALTLSAIPCIIHRIGEHIHGHQD